MQQVGSTGDILSHTYKHTQMVVLVSVRRLTHFVDGLVHIDDALVRVKDELVDNRGKHAASDWSQPVDLIEGDTFCLMSYIALICFLLIIPLGSALSLFSLTIITVGPQKIAYRLVIN